MSNREETIIALVNARSEDEARRIVAEHPELLHPEVDAFLEALAAAQKDGRAKRNLEWYRALLARCREVGVEQAFVERSIPSGLETDVAEAQRLESLKQRDPGAISTLIKVYERILRFQLDEHPAFRASVQMNLGNAYRLLVSGDRRMNMKRAIECYLEALRFYRPETAPREYAMVQNSLGIAYRNLPADGENLSRAVNCYREALRFFTPETAPREYARIQNNLGVAYQALPTDDRAANLKRAIESFLEALRFNKPETAPVDYASAQNNLGNVYRELPTGDRAVNLARAIECYREALRFRTPEAAPQEYAMTQNNLGLAYYELPTSDRSANLARAIECFHEALRYRTPQAAPREYADTQNNLGVAYLKLPLGNQETNLTRAVECFQEALRFWTPESSPGEYAQTQNNLGNAYAKLPTGDREANLLKAIGCYEEALRFRTLEDDPVGYAATQVGLGNVYLFLPPGDGKANLSRAINCFREALRVFTPETDPREYANVLNSLGLAYLSSIKVTEDQTNLTRAIQSFQEALRFRTAESDPVGYATVQNNLGTAYLILRGDREKNENLAIESYRKALQVYTPDTSPREYAETQNNLGNAYYRRLFTGDRRENVRRAIESYQEALRFRTLESSPREFRKTSRNLADLFFGERKWSLALEAYQAAMDAGELIYRTGLSVESKASEVAENASLHHNAAFATAELGNAVQALLILERGKTRLLGDALRLKISRPAHIPDEVWMAFEKAGKDLLIAQSGETSSLLEVRGSAEDYAAREEAARTASAALGAAIDRVREHDKDFLKELDLSTIQAFIPDEHTALITFTITDHGCMGFIVTSNRDRTVQTVPLSRPNEDDLRRWLIARSANGDPTGEWLEAYLSRDADRWRSTIERVLGKVSKRLLTPVLAALPPGISKLIILPSRGLALLPLHAAPLTEAGQERVCDRYLVSYAPSVEVLSNLQAKARQVKGKDLYAVINPEEDPQLVYAPSEGRAIASLFAGREAHHEGRSGTREKVRAGVRGRAYLHFSCHGQYSWNDPTASGLALADGRLTLADLQRGTVDLSAARLVTLSACETGLTDILKGSAEEYVGLPAGFMVAGVPCVVSSLWSVPDLSTALLMERFHRNHLEGKMGFAAALQEAQFGVRTMPAEEVAAHAEKCYKEANEENRADLLKNLLHYRHLAKVNPNLPPFVHPYYWAAFTVNGI